MMRPCADLPAVYLCRDVVDFRKGINGLAVLVEEALQQDPFSEQLFVFCNRTRDKVKILYWEGNGFCLWQKRMWCIPAEGRLPAVRSRGASLNRRRGTQYGG